MDIFKMFIHGSWSLPIWDRCLWNEFLGVYCISISRHAQWYHVGCSVPEVAGQLRGPHVRGAVLDGCRGRRRGWPHFGSLRHSSGIDGTLRVHSGLFGFPSKHWWEGGVLVPPACPLAVPLSAQNVDRIEVDYVIDVDRLTTINVSQLPWLQVESWSSRYYPTENATPKADVTILPNVTMATPKRFVFEMFIMSIQSERTDTMSFYRFIQPTGDTKRTLLFYEICVVVTCSKLYHPHERCKNNYWFWIYNGMTLCSCWILKRLPIYGRTSL